ncbi:MAG: hypothetical protein JSV12_03045 [Candidatus Bathyarchaeota archaeon]|nr:MAG: hypothetical protein JSV12_03045 [Candidatus Bathyarchaeota archaeon]
MSQTIQIWSNEDLKRLRKDFEKIMYCVTAANGFGAEVQDVREKLEEVTQATNIREAMNLLLQAKMMLDKEVGKLGRIAKLRFLGDVY